MAEEIKKQSRIKKFFKDYKSEFKKIVWPDKKDTTKMSGLVLAAIVVSGLILFLLDTGLSKIMIWLGTVA